MKKILSTLTSIGLLLIPAIGLAAPVVVENIPQSTIKDMAGILGLMDTIGTYIFTGLLTLAAVFMVIAGYFFVTGGGDAAKVKTARQMLINALIGLAVGFGARGLIAVIKDLVK